MEETQSVLSLFKHIRTQTNLNEPRDDEDEALQAGGSFYLQFGDESLNWGTIHSI